MKLFLLLKTSDYLNEDKGVKLRLLFKLPSQFYSQFLKNIIVINQN